MASWTFRETSPRVQRLQTFYRYPAEGWPNSDRYRRESLDRSAGFGVLARTQVGFCRHIQDRFKLVLPDRSCLVDGEHACDDTLRVRIAVLFELKLGERNQPVNHSRRRRLAGAGLQLLGLSKVLEDFVDPGFQFDD